MLQGVIEGGRDEPARDRRSRAGHLERGMTREPRIIWVVFAQIIARDLHKIISRVFAQDGPLRSRLTRCARVLPAAG